MKCVFMGYGNDTPYYGDGSYTIGNVYETINIIDFISFESDSYFIDDNKEPLLEDLCYFEPIEKGVGHISWKFSRLSYNKEIKMNLDAEEWYPAEGYV